MDTLKTVVVDDSIFMRKLLKEILEQIDGIKVIDEGEDGYEAIEIAEKFRPDIMTLDITMPYKNGISSVKEILEVSPKTKIIMVTAMGTKLLIQEALNKGAREFITKPFQKEKILEVVENIKTEILNG